MVSASPEEPAAAADDPEPEDDKRAETLSQPVGDEEKGLAAALNRLEEMEVRLSRFAGDPGGAKPWLDTISRMTAVSTKLREEMEKLGQLIPKDMAEGVLLELLQPVEQGVRGMYTTLCQATGVVQCSKSEEAWSKECDRLFVRFGEEIFGEVSR